MEGGVTAVVEYSSVTEATENFTVNICEAPSDNGTVCQQSTSTSDICKDDNAAFMSSNETLIILQCEHCDYSTSKKHLLDLHNIDRHVRRGVKLFKCPDCDYSTKRKSNLRTHLKRHRDIDDLDETELFSCEKCDYKSRNKQDLQAHLRKHEKTKPFKCEVCDFSTIYSHSLQHHINSKHAMLRPFECTKCYYTSARRHDLKIHEARHTAEMPLLCHMCGFKTAHDHALKVHMMGHDIGNGPGPFICDICSYQGATKALMRKHMKRHVAQKCHTCPICTYATSLRYNLKRHFDRHHAERTAVPPPEKSFTCTTCGYQTAYKSSLKRHMATHDRIKPYKCGHCDYSAINMSQMHVHMAKHIGIKPFVCLECDYKTANKQHLLAHAAKHSEVVLSCTHCDFQTKWKGQMKVHLKSHDIVNDDGSATSNWREVYVGSKSQRVDSLDRFETVTMATNKNIQRLSEVITNHTLLIEQEVATQVIEDANNGVSMMLREDRIQNSNGQAVTLVTQAAIAETLLEPPDGTDPIVIRITEESSESNQNGNQEDATGTTSCSKQGDAPEAFKNS